MNGLKLLYFSCVLCILMACQLKVPAPTPEGTEIPFETVALSEGGGVVKKPEKGLGPQLLLLTAPDEVSDLQEKIADEDFAKLQQVDYRQYVVIALFRGRKPTLNYQTLIDRIIERDGQTIVHAQFWEPNPIYGSGDATTAPYHLITVERQYLPASQLELQLEFTTITPTPPSK